jgi:hypothetical protein
MYCIVVEENGHEFYIDDKKKATLIDATSGAWPTLPTYPGSFVSNMAISNT